MIESYSPVRIPGTGFAVRTDDFIGRRLERRNRRSQPTPANESEFLLPLGEG